MRPLSILFILQLGLYLVLVYVSCVSASTVQPTSQPTVFFVAPTVPEDINEEPEVIFTDKPSLPPTISESASPTSEDGTGETFKEEIIEENRTAINTSSYIFYTFIGLIACVTTLYYVKRYVSDFMFHLTVFLLNLPVSNLL